MINSYGTLTTTYTVINIRKTFENFLADLRMIARRTRKWEQCYVEEIYHDIIKLAECSYLESVDVLLQNSSKVLQVSRYTVSPDGRRMNGDRPGGNNWPCIENTNLSVVVKYTDKWVEMGEDRQNRFRQQNNFKISWGPSSIDTAYSHLTRQTDKTYCSNGYELQKVNFN